DDSPSDKLVIDGAGGGGNASGSTFLQINNTDGLGALTTGNGILVVDTINGGTTNAGAFTLAGEVKAGAFEYLLRRGGIGKDPDSSNNWYLRSSNEVRIEVPADVAAMPLAAQASRSMLGTFFTRAGDHNGLSRGDLAQSELIEDGDTPHANLIWGRVFGETGRGGGGGGESNFGLGRNGPAYTYNYYGMQVGADLVRNEKDTLGLYFGASTQRSNVKDADSNHAGKVTMDALSLGGYWTHYEPSGWYTDAVLQADWYHNIRTHAASGEDFSTSGSSLTVSLETGYMIDLGEGLNLIPQMQFVYQYTSIRDGSDSFGRIHYSDTNALYGRLGSRLSKAWNETGLTAWVEANLWHQFGSDAKTTFRALDGTNPTTLSSRIGGTWGQALIGVSAPLTRNVSIYGTADYNFGLNQSGQSFGGQIGVNIGW
ncbi:MAG: autotransporter outer membrane beta-barrel domain-containing protein, partial [Phycisphaerales bacterium]|nr:autotransporter outer membrane beta-barrel domain-containing protein [Phycisphaerales bacterium]